MTVPTSWSPAALSTFSPIANFDIENSFWNHRCDYIPANQLAPLNDVSESGFRNFWRRLLLKCLGLRVPGCSSPVETPGVEREYLCRRQSRHFILALGTPAASGAVQAVELAKPGDGSAAMTKPAQ